MLVMWDMTCRPFHSEGLGVLHIQSINQVLLTRWVGRIISPAEDLAIKVSKDRGCKRLMPVHGASVFCKRL